MTDKERAVIEAARDVVDNWCRPKEDIAMCKIKKEIDALDAEQENDMEYKWLAMDSDGGCWHGDGFEWNGIMYGSTGDCYEVENPPSFLKPGQLWERERKTVENDIAAEREPYNGYWWRLAEDNSTTESFTCSSCNETFSGAAQDGKCTRCAGEGEWITDRRPTYDDAWSAIEGAMCPEVMVWDRFGASRCCWDQVGGRPWQPVPFCLRTPPKKPKCEECNHHFILHAETRYHVCKMTEKCDPFYMMDGCKFKRRGE